MPRTRRARHALLGVLAMVAAFMATVTSADAADGSWRASYSVDAADAMLIPGGSTTSTLVVENRRETPITVQVRVVDVVDDENGCLAEERRSALEDCDSAGEGGTGELSSQVEMALGEGTGVDLALDSLLGSLQIEPGEIVEVPVRLSLPAASTNETMTDRLTYTLRLRAADQVVDLVGGAGAGLDRGVAGDTRIAGPSVLDAGIAPLSFAWFAGAAGLVALLLAAARRRSREGQERGGRGKNIAVRRAYSG